jgi:AraC family transcriptional regulator
MILGCVPVVDAALRLHKEMWAEDSVRQGQPKADATPPRWLRQARDLAHDSFRERLSLGEIAFNVGIHPNHLSRMFRAYYGETVGEFARRLRLDEAVRQIAATRLPIGEIAANAGYCDNAHFSRECRRVLGVSPLAVRRSL